jgi:DNA-binding NarL/FixJ family response regulator
MLSAALDYLLAGLRCFVHIVGEAGIGKSCMREELTRDVDARAVLSRSPARPTNGESLTSSEATIVRLVGEGLMNGEIADRLVVLRRTVESHLSRVFVEVGVTSRTQPVAAGSTRLLP